ncbi:MAG: SDR family oxidoreductase [Anaerolineales bacterium]|nr:SDR family oxidoreductase [Anaerolineales bacterium]MCX7753832.1 SDR family oxidoreductase [Anaerolineales bacterium]MDW8276428.1 SDR family oxidoreductase [Anaerolineales bacterium]
MDLKLHGKRALVTGASRGLGFATARLLSREGALVAINGRDETRLQTAVLKISNETRGHVQGVIGDVSQPGQAEWVVREAAETLGGLDLLVCNAGGPPPGAFESFDEETWQKAINLTFMSNVRLIKAALPYLRRSDAASVLTVTSYSVKQPIVNLVLSNSIRSATVGLTKSLALELGKDGIRFNSILPAWTETERVTELMTARARANGTTVEEEIAKQARESPFGRMAAPEEFANVAVFLLSPAASYLTGVMLSVDGGMYKGVF